MVLPGVLRGESSRAAEAGVDEESDPEEDPEEDMSWMDEPEPALQILPLASRPPRSSPIPVRASLSPAPVYQEYTPVHSEDDVPYADIPEPPEEENVDIDIDAEYTEWMLGLLTTQLASANVHLDSMTTALADANGRLEVAASGRAVADGRIDELRRLLTAERSFRGPTQSRGGGPSPSVMRQSMTRIELRNRSALQTSYSLREGRLDLEDADEILSSAMSQARSCTRF